MKSKEQLHTEVQSGRLVSIAWEQIRPIVEKMRESRITAVTQDFRAGKSPNDLYPAIAAIVAVQDLENEIRMKLLQSERASVELMKEAKL